MSRVVLPLLVFTMSLFFSSCDNKKSEFVIIDNNVTIQKGIQEVDQFLDRYVHYWDFFVKKELSKSYPYELPYLNYLRSLEWYEEFHASNKSKYVVELLSVSIEEGDPNILLARTRFHMKSNITESTDRWVFVDGVWYHYYSQSILPPRPKPLLNQVLQAGK